MSLRSCLFTRKVFDTNGRSVGTIRVEFIPELEKESQRKYDKTGMKRRAYLESTQEIEKKSSSENDSSMESTEEF